MIHGFCHRGLQRLFESRKVRSVQSQHAKRVAWILELIHAAETVVDLRIPGYDLHPLTGERKGLWAMPVSGSWLIAFRLEDYS